jgi:hypothetical protein
MDSGGREAAAVGLEAATPPREWVDRLMMALVEMTPGARELHVRAARSGAVATFRIGHFKKKD